MADTLTKPERSVLMGRIHGSGNRSTELIFARLLRRHRITGWRRGVPLVGKPDFVFRKFKVAVFIDGDFWHGHPRYCRMPAQNAGYWRAKIARNRKRDRAVTEALKKQGWRIIRVWEHELKSRHIDRKFVYLKTMLRHLQ